jgi:hypothetical protein
MVDIRQQLSAYKAQMTADVEAYRQSQEREFQLEVEATNRIIKAERDAVELMGRELKAHCIQKKADLDRFQQHQD